MDVIDRWNIISSDNIINELSKLSKLPSLDRKIQLTCHPLGVFISNIFWQYIDTNQSNEFSDGRFVAMPADKNGKKSVVQVMFVDKAWKWSVYIDGINLSASGHNPDVEQSMKAGASAFQDLIS